jgi:hypothetical protein
MAKPLSAKQRAELSVGTKKQTERPLPEYVQVVRLGLGLYAVRTDTMSQLFEGPEGLVHNWLGRHDYKRVQFTPGSWVTGLYKRPKEAL